MLDPIVTIQDGKLRGKIALDYTGGQFYSFQGIPYGKPPIGELRFKAPKPAESWTGIRDATKEASECYSRHFAFRHIIGSEDCLHLNVYTPQLPTCSQAILKPVMVWIHGGAFMNGSGNTDLHGPEFLMPQDVVAVTLNYRLGVLGFLSLENSSLGVPGNAALKDVVLALQWIQKNIKFFNGDSNNVTLFGQSSGSVMCHYMMLSNMTKGLFHKVIAQSGTAINFWAAGIRFAGELCEILGCESTDEKEMLDFLRHLPVSKLLEGQEKLKNPLETDKDFLMGPVVEKESDESVFLSELPIDIITSGKFIQVPFMTGFASREGFFFELLGKRRKKSCMITDFKTAVPKILHTNVSPEKTKEVALKIKSFYYGDDEPTQDNIEKYYFLQTDQVFSRAILQTIKNQLPHSKYPIYLYHFSLESSLNIYKQFTGAQVPGVAHGDDIGYLFKNIFTPKIQPNSIEDITIRRFTKLWTTFARYGDPNPPVPDPLINIRWEPVRENELKFLNIDENLTVGVNPVAERMQFWDQIYQSHPVTSKL